MFTIAIHPDSFTHANGERQSFSGRWSALGAATGTAIREVDAYSPDLMDRLQGCDGFMWRFDFAAPERLVAKRVLQAVEQAGTPVFPSSRTAWHFEDKVAQHYLLAAARLPTPRTWVFWDRARAMEFAREAAYPLVVKFAHGYRSANVRLLRGPEEARYVIETMFGPGACSLEVHRPTRLRSLVRRARAAARTLQGRPAQAMGAGDEWQQGYVYFQEFLPGNTGDTRVTVIGDRAFAFRRFNRPDDFRASGSGRIDWTPDAIDPAAVRLAFDVARTLGTQCVAVDCLRRGDEPVVGEISYTFASWAVRDCPGHWTLPAPFAPNARLTWVPGNLAPEDAIFHDFLDELRQHSPARHALAR